MESFCRNIDKKYEIFEKRGYGGTSLVYRVKDLKSKKIYAAKLFEKKTKFFDIEVEMLKELKQANNPYILNMIDNGTGNIELEDKVLKDKQYLILEYASKGDLFDYLYYPSQGFKEIYAKMIFTKILTGLISCHNKGICHRDLKLANILLDDNFNPKICDFGFATYNTGKCREILGTNGYIAPEIYIGKKYDGFKADIFSLGPILINLVTCKSGFGKAKIDDPLYVYIKAGDYKGYYKKVDKQIAGVSEDLKELYFKLVSYNPNKRPTLKEISEHKWLDEIRNLNEEQLKKVKEEILEEFLRREPLVNSGLKAKTSGTSISMWDNDRGIGDNYIKYFDLGLKPKFAKIGLPMKNCIEIEGNLSPADFMNNLANKIDQEFNENCKIDESKKALKFDITFEEELKVEEEIPKELEEELDKLGIEENEEIDENLLKKDCIIQCKLYQSLNGGHILKISKKSGEKEDFFNNYQKIISLVKEIL